MTRYCVKATCVCFTILFVMLTGLWLIPSPPQSSTMGEFSENRTDHKKAEWRISNSYAYKTSGQYLFFPLKSETRNNVVLQLKWHETDHKSGVYYGTCQGLIEKKIDGCPFDPPFILVTDCVSQKK